MTSQEDSIAPIEALGKSLYRQKELHDCVLEGIDGVKVSACRCVLASRSKFFKKMLYGGFTEASKPVVNVTQEGHILESIVEYLHTGAIAMLEDDFDKENQGEHAAQGDLSVSSASDSTTNNDTCEQALLKLNSAALYFDLPDLPSKIEEKLVQLIKRRPEASFGVLAMAEAPSTPAEALRHAWENVNLNKGGILHNTQVLESMNASVVELILRHENHTVTEFELFQMLQTWAKGGDTDQEDERRETAKSLCQQYIRVELMDVRKISTEAADSGFFTDAQLNQAYKLVAIEAMEAQDQDIVLPPRKKRRLGPSISVQGAGSGIINGNYYCVGLKDEGYADEVLTYIKSDDVEWKSHKYEARIYTAPTIDRWRICLVPTGRKMVDSHVGFYSAKKEKDDNCKLPPSDGWYKRREGLDPAPKLAFLE